MKDIIKQYAGNQREQAFDRIDQLIDNCDGNIVETGCIRTWPRCPDGASTIILASLANDYGRYFTSIDINSQHVATAKRALDEVGIFANQVTGDSIAALRSIETIGFLYLDSFDYQAHEPEKCQRHAMAELGAAWGGLSWRCIIAMDDWNPDNGGKGGYVIPYLLDNGFNPQYEGYIRVFSRGM